MTRNTRSDALHEAVQRFATGHSNRTFLDLALEIADFQAEFSPGFARLMQRGGRPPRRATEIPGVPSDAFRLTRVALHPASEDRVRFVTSGTTGAGQGIHAMRRVDTYRALSLAFGRKALLAGDARPHVVALAPRLAEPPTSSLGYMMALFMADFEGLEPIEVNGPERWLIGEQGIDVDGLRRAARRAQEESRGLVILATSFALVALLDALAGRAVSVPEQTVIMQTGGFKGKSREIAPDELRQLLARAFGLPEAHIVSEYGMTELTSQLYEATLPGSELQRRTNGTAGTDIEPAWLQVVPVDPVSLEPVASGEVGLARIVDLGNIDSAIAVQTQDRVRRVADGIQLRGRAPGAPARGCSLSVEAFLAARSQ